MARSSHQVQHKTRRESKEVEVKTENQQLRSESQKLRRENARLRRELQKRLPAEIEAEEQQQGTPTTLEVPVATGGCPACGSADMRTFQTPTKLMTICNACKWRKVD